MKASDDNPSDDTSSRHSGGGGGGGDRGGDRGTFDDNSVGTITTTTTRVTQQKHLQQQQLHQQNNNESVVKFAGSRKLTIRNEPHHNSNDERRIHFVATFVAGVGSGALASIICAPLDLMRTRMQVYGDIQQQQSQQTQQQQQQQRQTQRPTTATNGGPKAAFQQIIEKEGWKGMFRGLGMTLVTVPIFWGIYFPLYDQTKHYMYQKYYSNCNDPTTSTTPPTVRHQGWIHMSSAVFTGAVADLICNPLFVVRTRLQTQALHQLLEEEGPKTKTTTKIQSESSSPSGIIQTTRELYLNHGYKVFWRGMTANLIGLSHVAVQFPTYEFMKQMFRESHYHEDDHDEGSSKGSGYLGSKIHKKEETAFELLVASGVAKMCASLISYPHEVLRSRMMDNRSAIPPTLRGTAIHIYEREGLRGFYSGLPITLVRVIPNCCVTFLSYEMILRHCKVWLSSSQSQP